LPGGGPFVGRGKFSARVQDSNKKNREGRDIQDDGGGGGVIKKKERGGLELFQAHSQPKRRNTKHCVDEERVKGNRAGKGKQTKAVTVLSAGGIMQLKRRRIKRESLKKGRKARGAKNRAFRLRNSTGKKMGAL